MFSFVLLDESVTPSRIIAARDHIGITTLYQGWSSKHPGATYFASEPITGLVAQLLSFPIGRLWAAYVPRKRVFGVSLNPGPFTIKEHVLITVLFS